MSEFREFLHMGGYGPFVWSSFAITFVVLGGIVGYAILEHRKIRRETLKRAGVQRRGKA